MRGGRAKTQNIAVGEYFGEARITTSPAPLKVSFLEAS